MTSTCVSDPLTAQLLIVHDLTPALKQLKRSLQRQYYVTSAYSGEEAQEMLSYAPFQLVMTGTRLPKMSGFELLDSIRKSPRTRDLPVILVAAKANRQEIVRGLQAGANDFISLPADIDIIHARVKRQITLKQALDDRQNALDRLRAAQEMKDEFLRMVTHDLKNPLTNIKLAYFCLREVIADDPAATEVLETIGETANQMRDLVEDFLDTTALKNGKTQLELEPLPAEGVIREVVAQYESIAARKPIRLLVGRTQAMLLADSRRLMQILSNLLSNAIKYSAPDTHMTIAAETRGERVRISVTDEGPGVPETERKRLFQAFGRLNTQPTGGESSTGLGLWIVKELVRLHGGEVGVNFPASGGSTFWIELPAAPSRAAATTI